MKLKRIKTKTITTKSTITKEGKGKNKQKIEEKNTTTKEREIENKVTKNKKTEEKKEGKNESKESEKTKKTKENNISILKRTTILFIDYIILSIISMKLLFYTENLYKTQSSFIEIFLYLNLLGIIAFFYSLYFLKVYNATPGMMLMNVKFNIINKNNIKENKNKEKNLSIIKYSLLYYSIFLSSLIVIIELLSQLFLKNTTMFEIISKTKLSENK